MTDSIIDGFRVGGRETSVEWYTPPSIFAALGLEFDLDPCAPALPSASWIPTLRRISLPDDGLAANWNEGGTSYAGDGDVATRVWLNPPYGRDETGRWVGRLVDHGRGIAFIFARTDTQWWQRAAARATAVCLIAGRVSFVPGDGQPTSGGGHNAGAPSCLLAFGEDCARALERSRLGLTFRSANAQLPEGLFP